MGNVQVNYNLKGMAQACALHSISLYHQSDPASLLSSRAQALNKGSSQSNGISQPGTLCCFFKTLAGHTIAPSACMLVPTSQPPFTTLGFP